MMKILGAIAALILVIILLGFVLPADVHVERETVIDAPQEEVFALISDFEEWDRWSPWVDRDPNAEYRMSGEGVGARMEWTSDQRDVGTGSQEITALDPPNRMVTHLEFDGQGEADATFDLSPAENGATRVVWSLDTNMREGVPFVMKPIGTYMGFSMDKWIGKDYEEGLANLKRVAEAEA